MKVTCKPILIFLFFIFLIPPLLHPWSYSTRKIECPLCHHVNKCCHSSCLVLLTYYRQYWHFPFVYEISDQSFIYHCQNCRFTIFEEDLFSVFLEKSSEGDQPPQPEDLQYAKEVLGTFDFSHLHEKYKDKDLPRYYQNEILRNLYSKGFKNFEWRLEQMGLPEMINVSFNFIIGYEYQQAQCYDEAKAAFQQALFELNRVRDNILVHQPPTYEYYLYLGSLNYFLDRPIEAIRDYEWGMKLVDRTTCFSFDNQHTQLYLHNCFYHNSKDVLGPFWENPFRYSYHIRNIVFMRVFHIPFDSTLLAILVWFILAGLWFSVSKIEKKISQKNSAHLFYFFTVPVTLAITGFASYFLDFQYSLRSLLLITGLWSIFFLSTKKILQKKLSLSEVTAILLSRKYMFLYAGCLLVPWLLFFYVIDDFGIEIFRLILSNAVDFYNSTNWVMTYLKCLLVFLLATLGTYIIHVLLSLFSKQDKPGRWFSPTSLSFTAFLFFSLSWFMLKSRGHYNSDFLFLTFGTSWYLLFLLLEKYVAKPLASRFKAFNRLRYAFERSHWKYIRLLFLIYPAAFHIYPKDMFFHRYIPYTFFWPLFGGFIFLLHYLMAKTFKDSRNKLDYSILLTLLSTVSLYAAMELADFSEYLWADTPGFYLLGGILFLTFSRQYKAYAQRLQDNGKRIPTLYAYLSYNRLWYIIEGSFIVLPVLYMIIWSNRAGYAYYELQKF